MKLKAAAFLLTALLMAAQPLWASAHGMSDTKIDWNGKSVPASVSPYIQNGVTFVPIDMIGELKGISATRWFPDEGLARLWVDRGGVFQFRPGTDYADDMDKRYPLGATIERKNGVIMLPLRFVAEMAGADVRWDKKGNTVWVTQQRTAIASVPGTQKRLFAMTEQGGEYRGITLDWNGMLKSFPSWINPSNVGSSPRLLVKNLGGDASPEAVVLLNAGSGTGVYLEEPHIVDSRTFTEIPVEDPLEAVAQRLVSSVDRSGEDIVIRATADNGTRELRLDKTEVAGEGGWLPDHLGFGAIVQYDVRGGSFIAVLAGAAGIENFVGEAEIMYTFEDGAYTAKSVSFSFYE